MSIETFDNHYNMLDQMLNKYNSTSFQAALFGGEPLLNWKLIEHMVPILKKDKRCNVIIAMTNGIPLKDPYKRDFIEKNGVAISLSFDGLWNKENRQLHNGKSSLEEYTTEPLKSYFSNKGGCKVMVAPNNVSTMTENFKWFVEEYGINKPDYSLVRDDIWEENDIKNYDKECKRLADQVIEYYNKGVDANVGLFQLYLLDLVFGKIYQKRPFGCFAGCHGGAFMPDGLIYPCARFGSNKKLVLGDSNKKEIYDTVELMNIQQIINPSSYPECNDCELYNYCNAGCTYNQINSHQKDNLLYSKPLDSICRLLKISYRETMRISHELKYNKIFQESVKNSIRNVG